MACMMLWYRFIDSLRRGRNRVHFWLCWKLWAPDTRVDGLKLCKPYDAVVPREQLLCGARRRTRELGQDEKFQCFVIGIQLNHWIHLGVLTLEEVLSQYVYPLVAFIAGNDADEMEWDYYIERLTEDIEIPNFSYNFDLGVFVRDDRVFDQNTGKFNQTLAEYEKEHASDDNGFKSEQLSDADDDDRVDKSHRL